jgi:Putative auto-transporter adhesin, head GIN domain
MVAASAPRRGWQAAVLGLAAIGVALVGCGVGTTSSGVQGSGVAATQTRAVGRFSSVELAGDNQVTVVVGGRQSVVVHADSNLIGHVSTRVVAGTLVVADTGSFTTKSPMSVQVRVPKLAVVKLSGDGIMSVSGINAQQLTVTVPGDGMLSATGTAARLDVTLAGDGQAQLGGLVARDVHAVLTGSGVIQVTATTSLDAAVPGDGAIMYGGNPPHVTTSITGSGAVTPG